MRLQYPLIYPDGMRANRMPKKMNPKKDYKEAIGALVKELRLARAKDSRLLSNVHLNASGSVYGSNPGGPGVMLEFKKGKTRYHWLLDQYDRTADNIYAMSKLVHNWRMFLDSGVRSWREKMEVV